MLVPRFRFGRTLAPVLVVLAASGAFSAQDLPTPTTPQVPAPAVMPVPTLEAERPSFVEWLKGVRADALARGIRADTVDRAFDGLEPLPVVVERDRAQAEFKFSLDAYMRRRLTPKLVRDVRKTLTAHRALLARIVEKYGVPAPVIVSVWALESNLGRFTGVRPTIQALATLAWDGRRPFFRSELLDALTILDRGDITPDKLRGSWAGAMGQVQFMPSSYLKFAQDFDGDGRKDIWSSLADVFASIANYLRESGWTPGEPWGRPVTISARAHEAVMLGAPLRGEGCRAEREMTARLPMAQWNDLGVRTVAGKPLPRRAPVASLLDDGSRAWLLHPNYETLLRYNCAHAYALSVAVLSDRLAAPARRRH